MTVCRYFLQGNCRFGDRCRFEHTDPYAATPYDDSGYDYSYQNRGRSQAPHTNYDQNRNRPNNDKYRQNQQYYSSERNYQDSRYNYADSYNQGAESDYNANKSNRNKHTWVSENYKKQIEQKQPRSGNDRFFDTSTPKSKVSFSFKDTSFQDTNPPRSRHVPGDLHMNERNIIDAEIIKEDVLLWEFGHQWPFSCYCPTQGKPAFPGFVDLSPEELRLEFYKARENNTYNAYVESVEKALQEIKMKREQMKEPSIQLMLIIEKIRRGEKFDVESTVDGSVPSLSTFNQSTLDDMVAEEVPQATSTSFFGPPKSSAESFSFKTTPDDVIRSSASSFSFKTSDDAIRSDASSFSFKASDPGVRSSASSFSFKPSDAGVVPNVPAAGSDIYTPIEAISVQDKEQFSATTFMLGKIPTVPPCKEMCF